MNDNYLKIKKYIYQIIYGTGADIILKSIAQQQGKLNPELKRLSDEYAQDVLGSKIYAKDLYIYCAIQNRFIEGWMPESYYFRKVIPLKKENYGKLGELNCLQSTLFGNNIFPDLAYLIGGNIYTSTFKIKKLSDFIDEIKEKHEKVVFKPDDSFRGEGVRILKTRTLSKEDLTNYGNGVIQSYIVQHPFFDKFSNTSVATIRLTTTIKNGSNASLIGSYLRIGRISDTHVKANSAVKVPIHSKTGELYEGGYSAEWKRIIKHPDTQVAFSLERVPHFDKCVELSLKLHEMIPYLNCIGWDMIIDENNHAVAIEWNGYNNGIRFVEATTGPCFKGLGWENLWKN